MRGKYSFEGALPLQTSFNKLPLLRSVASLKTFPLSKGVRYWRLREQDTEGEFKRGEASLK